MIFTETREIPEADLVRLQAIIDGKSPWPERTLYAEDIISVLAIEFGDGWEMDINIVKGEPTPYVDAILFHDGSEVYTWEIRERVTGCWELVLGGDINRAFRLEVFLEGEL